MPYIPEQHKRYNLLPDCCKYGGEVFEYPSDLLNKVNDMLPAGESLMPYGFSSYEDYYAEIDKWIMFFSGNEEASLQLLQFREEMLGMNCKESWSVLKYIGPRTNAVCGLTPGRYYYWPCSLRELSYRGVVDDEEFTAYLYPTNAEYWEIAEDPTEMAKCVLSREPTLWEQPKIDNVIEQFKCALTAWENQ